MPAGKADSSILIDMSILGGLCLLLLVPGGSALCLVVTIALAFESSVCHPG